AVNAVLEEIGAAGKPTLMAFNKADQVGFDGPCSKYFDRYPHSVAISARTGRGIPELLGELSGLLKPARDLVELRIPHEASAIIARLHSMAQVVERDYN